MFRIQMSERALINTPAYQFETEKPALLRVLRPVIPYSDRYVLGQGIIIIGFYKFLQTSSGMYRFRDLNTHHCRKNFIFTFR